MKPETITFGYVSRRFVLAGGMAVWLVKPGAAKAAIDPGQFAATLRAIAARIWPATPDAPGAVEAGVADYILRALASAYADKTAFYENGLAALNRAAVKLHGAAFVNLAAVQKDALLAALEKDGVPDFPPPGGAAFFTLIRRHVLEGLFADPIYGGNRNFSGWRAVGYSGAYYGYSADEQTQTGPLTLPPIGLGDLQGQPA